MSTDNAPQMIASSAPGFRLSEAELAEIRERLSAAYIEKSKFEQLIEQLRVREDAERLAREQLGLARPDETVFLIREEDASGRR
mgnify:CR=1 FL=1